MNRNQIKNSIFLFSGNILLKLSNFGKQILFAFFLGVSKDIDLLLVAQIVPTMILAMIGGSGGEIIVTRMKKENKLNSDLVLFFILIAFFISIILYSPIFLLFKNLINWFDISAADYEKFKLLTLIFFINLIPATIVSILKPVLYYIEKYKYYIITTLISELFGLIFIYFFAKQIGIFAFGYGVLIISLVNMVLFVIIIKLKISNLFKIKFWLAQKKEIIFLYKSLAPLSGQVFISRLTNFFERSLSVKYLKNGYLSAFNYSKTITELPQGIIMSSILTTTYIEQIKQYKIGLNEFKNYTKQMTDIILTISVIFQIVMTVFAPILVIIFFRRGAFTNSDVVFMTPIIQIFLIGLYPLIFNKYLIRTYYVLAQYKRLFILVLIKTFIQIAFILFFINRISHALPISYIIGPFFNLIVLPVFINKKIVNTFYTKKIIIIGLISIVICLLINYINLILIPFYLGFSNWRLFIYSIPLGIIFLLLTYIYLKGKNIVTFNF